MKYVYVLIEEGSWDYEPSSDVEIFDTFAKALAEFKDKVEQVKEDMAEWIDNAVCKQTIDEAKEYANFKTYEDGDFTRLHDTVTIEKKEVK